MIDEDGQTPAEWLEARFNSMWDRHGRVWVSALWDGARVFHMLPVYEDGGIPHDYYAAGNMISLRGDEQVSYLGIRNEPVGPDTDSDGYPAHAQGELITL